MGCGASSLRGDDIPSINATSKPSLMRRYSTPKPTTYVEHYETQQEHDAELRRIQSSQQARRPSRPAYVDPDSQPMPPKTTHQHYHRLRSESQMNTANEGWRQRAMKVKSEVAMPSGLGGFGKARGQQQGGIPFSGVIVPNNQRHRSFIG